MNKILITISLSLLLVFAWGCEDYLDVNHDPNVIEEIPEPKVLLPAAQVGLANQLMGWDFGFGGAYWVQYWTQNYTASQFKILCEYRETSFGNAYNELTAGVLNDLKRIKDISSEDSTNHGDYFVAEALSIFTWQIMTDVWGSIPYFEALQGDEGLEAPAFDEGSVIYEDLLKRIDDLLKIDLSESSIDGDYDFVYGGDLDAWYRFANSLKLKLMIRLSETSQYDSNEVLNFVQNNDFLETSAKISGNTWEDGQEGKRHPMREFEEGGADYLSTNVIACKSFIDYLDVNGDGRVSTLFTEGGDGYVGAFFGDFDSKQDSDSDGIPDDEENFSETVFSADMDLMIMSEWEVNFYIAEAYARANDFVNAETYYVNGVSASFEQHGISEADTITDAGMNGYAAWIDIDTQEEAVELISMQKWVANANYQHIESFLERNRTKYPSVNDINISSDRQSAWENFPVGSLTISVNGRAKTNGNLPASPTYPEAVLTRNSNAPGQKVDLLEKVWWDQKPGK
ncbi:SusD-like starch-binding protein associating with outer membrane [Marinilabilia salmonicolor]|uniref:SusD-like starch-binding protein associating with outer membrane n=1 Tax=Marinilabilia salmonicolor TaxID=989 RepID=A0A368UJ08_9BACT|nr:SusD/RagB family nutrient-binding outer membrane lipoprotein [Marinilabilia salmonicolor]RCW26074.1 SusD-like starch-binding protein associating with outer membrane [Marinilabilia salmonicolor]